MGQTSFTTNNALTKKLWDEKLYRDIKRESYFSRFEGSTSDSLVQVKEQLVKEKGDKITFGLRMRLTGAGVTGAATLEGNEEALSSYDYSVSLERYRHAVKDDGELTRQRAMFSIDEESEMAIKDWGAEKKDELMFDALTTSSTHIAYLDGGASGAPKITTTPATAKSGVSATYKLTLDFISFLKTYASTGGNRTLVPIRPVKVNGKKYFVLLVHPDCLYDLETSSDFKQSMREAEVRGSENPLFQGAVAVWNGVVIHSHENMPIANDGGGGSVSWAKAQFMGAQSLVWAWGKKPQVIQKKFDYDEQHGYALAMTAKAGKPQFNSVDFGSLGVYLSRTKVSDLV